ncbi:adenylosuccinate synthase [Acanthopleuribacter pedis]|uniref:adenylosuccinate synthase n=1 Tax=Acanthopleuribacter pedis TaxID=442870 RepID=UPI001FAF9E4B|nr:adenylosuccinate synthase [Acanthopleuribacter pedis]
MKNVAVAGAQWGDEGKGKVVDILAQKFDFVIRYQGGHNAGHSVVFGGKRYALHVLPSGVFHPDTVNIVGNGVVVDPFALLKEIEGMAQKGLTISPDRLLISDRAHIILPYHGIIDRWRESGPGKRHIGTTGRGIGPAYEWKASRRGLRFCDARDKDLFRNRIEAEYKAICALYGDLDELKEWPVSRVLEESIAAVDRLLPHVVDSVYVLAEARRQKKRMLFEGAQATLLDVDFGTYPYVTSSNSCVSGITAGAGVPPAAVERTIGICKAYTTRVGKGPFPTELHDDVGGQLRDAGHEYGTTTGRPRRCGWLDLVALKYTHLINEFTTLAIMKLDVMDKLEEVKLCVGYTIDGKETQQFPAALSDLERVKPVYKSFPGWKTPLHEVRRYDALPVEAKRYLEAIQDYIGCPIGLVSVGPDREQTIFHHADYFN